MEKRRVLKPRQPSHPPPRARVKPLKPVAKSAALGSRGRGKPTRPRPPPAKIARSEHGDRRRIEDRRSERAERSSDEELDDRRLVEEPHDGGTDDGEWKGASCQPAHARACGNAHRVGDHAHELAGARAPRRDLHDAGERDGQEEVLDAVLGHEGRGDRGDGTRGA